MQKPQFIHLSAIFADSSLSDTVVAVLGEAGFTTFEETATGISAYIAQNEYDESLTHDLMSLYFPEKNVVYTTETIASENWNEEWEKNYPNLYIENFCQVLPSFRTPLEGFEHTIIIDPKMSFGTGHHDTTQMVMLHLREMELVGKKVMDMGCGTAILAILAEQLGASAGLGIDIDPWCIENSQENLALNHCKNISLILGGATDIPQEAMFEIFLANINRNILLQDGTHYIPHIHNGGELVISGFYEEDIPALVDFFEKNGMKLFSQKVQNKWASLRFVRK